ncbi:MAG: DUF86 domain-containing protein [Candidatus Nanohaloarchaea archaeon]
MDEERILIKLDQMDQYLDELGEDLPKSLEAYKERRRKYERLLHLSIETVVDISSLILKQEGLGAPEDEESIFDKLIEADIFDEETGEKLKDMKAFRNVLVHRYGEIKDEEVYGKLDQLEDFERFRQKILEYLEEN